MKYFIVYDDQNNIRRSGYCQDIDFELQAVEGMTLIEAKGDAFSGYIQNGQYFEYTQEQKIANMRKQFMPQPE